MRITLATALVLQAISRGHRYGFEIVEVTGYPTGTVYPALRRLERAGYLRSAWEGESVAFGDARPQRRNYVVTAAGTRVLKEALAPMRALGGMPRLAPKGAR